MSFDISIPQEISLKINIISLIFYNNQYPITTQLLFKLKSSKEKEKEITLFTRCNEILIDESIEFLNIKSNTSLILQIVLNERLSDESNVSTIQTIEINNKLSKIQNDYLTELIIFKNNCELKIKYIITSSSTNNTLLLNETHIRCLTEENTIYDNQHNPSIISISNSHETNTSTSSSTGTGNYQQFLEYETERFSNEIEGRKSICECFYIAGIPLNNARMIPESEMYTSICKHKRCSLFPAYVPDLLFFYSKKNNTKFELTNSIASLSFPYGIKCCFNQNEKQIPSIDNFTTVTTNGNGKRYFIFMSFFYQKIDYVEFKSKYSCDPIKDQLINNRILTLIESHNNSKANFDQNQDCIEKEIESSLDLCEELINNDYIYLPACFCLVSKLPYINQMQSCLASISKMISVSSFPKEIEKFLIHLLYEIPRPSSNTELSFFIPYNPSPISINGKYIKDLPIQLSSMSVLFEYFNLSLIVEVFTLLLNEQKIVFISNDYNKLTEISNCFISLLYPLKWNFTYIPILTTGMIRYLQSFIPFIMGMDETMLLMSKEYLDSDSVIYLVTIKEKRKSELVKSSKNNLNNNDEAIVVIPNDLKQNVINQLRIIKKNIDKENIKGRKVFIKLLANIIGDYNKYVSFIENCAFFNNDSFLYDNRHSDVSFYEFFINTGLFRQFIQDKKAYPYFDKIALRIKANKRIVKIIKIDKKKISSKTLFNSTREFPKMIFIRDSKENNKKNSSSNLNIYNLPTSNKQSSKNVKQINSTKRVISSINKEISNQSSFESDTINETLINNRCINYIIPPYFIQFLHLGLLNLNKIQCLLKEKYKHNDPFSLIQTKFISNICISISSDITYNHYHLPNQRQLRLSWKRKQSMRMNSNDESLIRVQELMKSILSCDQTIIDFDLSLLSLKSNSKVFVDILYQDKFKEQNLHILNKKSFERLSHIIFSAMLLSSFDYKQIKLITQSLFYYCKICDNGKGRYYMFENFAIKKPFEAWINVDFWEEWFRMEAIQNSLVNGNDYQDYDNISTNERYFMKILEIAIVMNDLNISLQFQFFCLIEKIAKKYIQGADSKEQLSLLEKTIIQQYNNKQKELD